MRGSRLSEAVHWPEQSQEARQEPQQGGAGAVQGVPGEVGGSAAPLVGAGDWRQPLDHGGDRSLSVAVQKPGGGSTVQERWDVYLKFEYSGPEIPWLYSFTNRQVNNCDIFYFRIPYMQCVTKTIHNPFAGLERQPNSLDSVEGQPPLPYDNCDIVYENSGQ